MVIWQKLFCVKWLIVLMIHPYPTEHYGDVFVISPYMVDLLVWSSQIRNPLYKDGPKCNRCRWNHPYISHNISRSSAPIPTSLELQRLPKRITPTWRKNTNGVCADLVTVECATTMWTSSSMRSYSSSWMCTFIYPLQVPLDANSLPTTRLMVTERSTKLPTRPIWSTSSRPWLLFSLSTWPM